MATKARAAASSRVEGKAERASGMAPWSLDQAQQDFFAQNGYLILSKFFDAALMTRMKRRIDKIWETRSQNQFLVIDAYIGADTQDKYRRCQFSEIEKEARDFPNKINDLHLEDPLVRDIVTDARLVAALRGLLGASPLVCSSLLLERGSEQGAHFDTFFMPPKTPNMMAASWVAIDPVGETNGPLFYYPKSHLIPPYHFSNGGINMIVSELPAANAHIDRVVSENGLTKTFFYPEVGDVLIWHAQLLHGGSQIRNSRETRASLVTHYFTEVDYPLAKDRIVVGEGRYMLNKPRNQQLPPRSSEVDAFLASLSVTAEQLGRVPAGFNPRSYLLKHADVFHAGVNPFQHYIDFGAREGREW
jgi:ectoine hydroxylase-related dioxygenase (phytanoyl-CoA dioxygenase family)